MMGVLLLPVAVQGDHLIGDSKSRVSFGDRCIFNSADGVISIKLPDAVGCKCNYFESPDSTTVKEQVKVKCPGEYVCTTNSFNNSGVNVCLLRLGQQCSSATTDVIAYLGGATAQDALCEGGAICDQNSQTCKVDTGDTTLSGALESTTSDLRDTVRRFINIGLGFLGVLTVLMVIYGGYMWLTAAGAEDKVTKGKNILIWAAIGAIVISIAWTISSYVLQVGRTVG